MSPSEAARKVVGHTVDASTGKAVRTYWREVARHLTVATTALDAIRGITGVMPGRLDLADGALLADIYRIHYETATDIADLLVDPIKRSRNHAS